MLKLTGKSGVDRTVSVLIPTKDTVVTFNFVYCADADSNHYAVVQIGTQLWMEENLKTTKYRNGDSIPNITNDSLWINDKTGAYCNINNTTNTDTIDRYGRLYNWFSVDDSRNIAPYFWHVASDSEWTMLTTYLGGDSVAGDKLKDYCLMLGKILIMEQPMKAVFTALPGSGRTYHGPFGIIGTNGIWWSSTESSPAYGWTLCLAYYYLNVIREGAHKTSGFSVRCIKDQ